MASKQATENTEKSPTRSELADSSKKFGKLTLKIRKEVDGAESGQPVEAHEVEDQGEVVVRHVKKDDSVLQSAATQDAQESGEYEKAAKKVGDKKPVFTTPTMNAVQDYVESHEDETPKLEGEDAKLNEKTKEKKPKSKPSEGKKPDNSMSKQAKEKTGMQDKDGDRDIRKDMEKNLEKTDKIDDLANKRAAIKAKLEADTKASGSKNTKLTDLIATVKKFTSGPRPEYDPADVAGLASKIRSDHNMRVATGGPEDPKLKKHDDAACCDDCAEQHDKDHKLEILLEEKLLRHYRPKLQKADGDQFKQAVGQARIEQGVQQGLEGHQPPAQKAPRAGPPPKSPRYKLLTHMESNAKTSKNAAQQMGDKGIFSAILHLAPATLAGVGNVCCAASEGCRDACLNTAGRGGMFKEGEKTNAIQAARIRKTRHLAQNPGQFMDDLVHDINEVRRHAQAKNAKPVVRLNGTSDLAWEQFKLPQLGGKNVFEAFPDVQFYDYTKRPDRVMRNKHQNYHLTFSQSEKNQGMAKRLLAAGHNVAVVFGGKQLPKQYHGHPVISGDEHDLRFLDPRDKGYVVGLKAKGEAQGDKSGFVVFGHEGDPTARPIEARKRGKRAMVEAAHGKTQKSLAKNDDIEPVAPTSMAGKPGHTSTGKKMKNYWNAFSKETADWTPQEHMEAVAYHNKRATNGNLGSSNKWDMSRAMEHYLAARKKGGMPQNHMNGSRHTGIGLPADHETFMKKIGMAGFDIGKTNKSIHERMRGE